MTERNVVINIDTLNLNVGAQRPGISDMLAAVLGGAGITGLEVHAERVSDKPRVSNGADTGEAEAAVAQDTTTQEATSLSRQAIIDFIRSDARYTMRTLKSVMEHFGETQEAFGLINQMESEGTLERKVRRRDGAYLLKVTDNVVAGETDTVQSSQADSAQSSQADTAQSSQADSAAVQSNEVVASHEDVSHEDVQEFLEDNEQYRMRSFDAIAKRFPGASREHLQGILDDLVSDGDVYTRRRRSDGARLYEAA